MSGMRKKLQRLLKHGRGRLITTNTPSTTLGVCGYPLDRKRRSECRNGQAARGDRHVYASRTRFIPEPMLDRFARTSWPPPSQAAGGRAPQPDIRVDLEAKMRGMWR